MNKTLVRWSALVLISCLVADPATCQVITFITSPSVATIVSAPARFSREAIPAHLIAGYHKPGDLPAVRISQRERTLRRVTGTILSISALLSLFSTVVLHNAFQRAWPGLIAGMTGGVISFVFSLWPVNYFIGLIWSLATQLGPLTGREERNDSHFANVPLNIPLTGETAPRITIHMPIFLESFEVIRPSLDAAQVAVAEYNRQFPDRSNFVISDDGLGYLTNNDVEGFAERAREKRPSDRTPQENEVLNRLTYYAAHDLAVIARPKPEGTPETERRGIFKKASNLNYTLRLADGLTNNPAYQKGWQRGHLWIGDLLVPLDKDSITPPGILAMTAPEFVADPTLSFTQHSTVPTNENESFFASGIGMFNRMMYRLGMPSKILLGGFVSFMGHNGFVRTAHLREQGYWDEDAASEDLVFAMRVEARGNHGKYIMYPGMDFGEMMSRTFNEEAAKFYRYSFGAAQVLFNPIPEWRSRGIWNEYLREYARSPHTSWASIAELLIIKMLFFNIAIAAFSPFLALLLPEVDLGGPWRIIFTVIGFNVFPTLLTSLFIKQMDLSDSTELPFWQRFWDREKKLLPLVPSLMGLSPYSLHGWTTWLIGRRPTIGATTVDTLEEKPLGEVLKEMPTAHWTVLTYISAYILVSELATVALGHSRRVPMALTFLSIQALAPYIFNQPLWQAIKASIRKMVGLARAYAPVLMLAVLGLLFSGCNTLPGQGMSSVTSGLAGILVGALLTWMVMRSQKPSTPQGQSLIPVKTAKPESTLSQIMRRIIAPFTVFALMTLLALLTYSSPNSNPLSPSRGIIIPTSPNGIVVNVQQTENQSGDSTGSRGTLFTTPLRNIIYDYTVPGVQSTMVKFYDRAWFVPGQWLNVTVDVPEGVHQVGFRLLRGESKEDADISPQGLVILPVTPGRHTLRLSPRDFLMADAGGILDFLLGPQFLSAHFDAAAWDFQLGNTPKGPLHVVRVERSTGTQGVLFYIALLSLLGGAGALSIYRLRRRKDQLRIVILSTTMGPMAPPTPTPSLGRGNLQQITGVTEDFSFIHPRMESPQGLPIIDVPSRQQPAPLRPSMPPSLGQRAGPGAINPAIPVPAFRTLADAIKFILEQRQLGAGLPATFRIPPGTPIPDPSGNGALRRVTTEGVGLYDTALSILALVQNGNLAEARQILDIYTNGYGRPNLNMNLRAFPTNDNQGAFTPLRSDLPYFFDFTRLNGQWTPDWDQWQSHTGPNAWMAIAIAAYVEKAPAGPQTIAYRNLLRNLCEAMILLQQGQPGTAFGDNQGGIRFAPQGVWHPADAGDPFLEINSENNVSAYAALTAASRVLGDPRYSATAARVLGYFKNAQVFNSETGQMQRGLFNPQTNTLVKGITYKNGRWETQREFATDSAGTWTISSLGPAQIDAMWGEGTAYKMLMTVRQRVGRTSNFRLAGPTDSLAGVDFTDIFPISQALISPEWSAGYIKAARLLVDYYRGKNIITAAQISALERDIQTITQFINGHPQGSHYAIGPGMAAPRNGATGHGWFSAIDGPAMASIYIVLPDPLSNARGATLVIVVPPTTPVAVPPARGRGRGAANLRSSPGQLIGLFVIAVAILKTLIHPPAIEAAMRYSSKNSSEFLLTTAYWTRLLHPSAITLGLVVTVLGVIFGLSNQRRRTAMARIATAA